MLRLGYFILTLFFLAATLSAQIPCSWGSEEAANALDKALHAQKTCRSAADLMDKCMWGSSADSEFAPIVIEKCEGEFFQKLSPAGKNNYETAMQLCAYEFARQGGTISISAAAMCQVGVASMFAANPVSNDHAPPMAGFDCAKAQSLLEKAICSDIRLGHADIVLSKVYRDALKEIGPDGRADLVGSERNWLRVLPTKCAVSTIPLTEKQVNCLRDQIETRFSLLDSCGDGEDLGRRCVEFVDDPANVDIIGPLQELSRASFDCEAPKTALQIVICADSELGQKDIQLSHAYSDADGRIRETEKQALGESERKWLDFVGSNCPLGAVGGIPPVIARACVRSALEVRIDQLKVCPTKPAGEQVVCLNNFQLLEK